MGRQPDSALSGGIHFPSHQGNNISARGESSCTLSRPSTVPLGRGTDQLNPEALHGGKGICYVCRAP